MTSRPRLHHEGGASQGDVVRGKDTPFLTFRWDVLGSSLHVQPMGAGIPIPADHDDESWLEMLAPETADSLRLRARAAQATGQPLEAQLLVPAPGGGEQLLWMHGVRVPPADPTAPLVGGICDITELAAGFALAADRRAAEPGRFSWDDEGRLLHITADGARLLGLDGPGAYLAEEVLARFAGDVAQSYLTAVLAAETGQPFDTDLVMELEGRVRTIRLRTLVTEGATGARVVTGSLEDLSDPSVHQSVVNMRRALNTLSHGTHVLNTALDEQDLLDRICSTVINDGGYLFAWYGVRLDDDARSVKPIAWAGYEAGYLSETQFSWDESVPSGRGPTGYAIRTGEVRIAHLLATESNYSPWREAALARGYVSSISLPVVVDGEVHGGLMVYASEPTAFDPSEMALLSNLASDIGYGLRRLTDVAVLKETTRAAESAERRYRMLAENSSDVVLLCDRRGVITWRSPSTERLTGLARERVLGKALHQLAHPEDIAAVAAVFLSRTSAPVSFMFRLRCADGSVRWMSAAGRWVKEESGADGLVLSLRDVDEQVHAEHALAERESRYRLLAENASDIVVQVDPEGRISWVSESVTTVLGWHGLEVLGRSALELVAPESYDYAAVKLADQVNDDRSPGQILARRADGSTRWMSVTSHRVITAEGVHRVLTLHDVEDTVRARLDLEHAIGHDPLTGLATRPTTVARLRRLLDELPDPRGSVAVLCLGLDGLRDVNDALGHTAGDVIITRVAARIAETVGDQDLVGRGGGDEFLVLVPALSDPADASVVADRLLAAVRGEIPIGPHVVAPTVSIGIAAGRRDAEPEDLLRDAGIALTEAKLQGRNRHLFADPVVAREAQRRLDVDGAIRNGLRNGEFVPWFQPIVLLPHGQLTGYEALVRWVRRDGTTVEPAAFLPVAERSSLITDIDLEVLQRSLSALRGLPGTLTVAVNVAAQSLTHPDYVDRAIELVVTSGVSPERLHLEITETAVLRITDAVRTAMVRIADIGVRWFMDDFGTGYSSISHLRDLPISGMKLDRSFTSALGAGDVTSTRLAQALGGLARGLELETVAEGVETEVEAAMLASYGWVHGQGWLYGKAAPLG